MMSMHHTYAVVLKDLLKSCLCVSHTCPTPTTSLEPSKEILIAMRTKVK